VTAKKRRWMRILEARGVPLYRFEHVPHSWPKSWMAYTSPSGMIDLAMKLQGFSYGTWMPLALDLFEAVALPRGVRGEALLLIASLRRLKAGQQPSPSTWRRLTTLRNKRAQTWTARYGHETHTLLFYAIEKLKLSFQRQDPRHVLDYVSFLSNHVRADQFPSLCDTVRARIACPSLAGFTA
jgi:hypothetical protein